jgi:hypothetical protein
VNLYLVELADEAEGLACSLVARGNRYSDVAEAVATMLVQTDHLPDEEDWFDATITMLEDRGTAILAFAEEPFRCTLVREKGRGVVRK